MKGVDLLILKDELGLPSNMALVRAFGISETSLYTHLRRDRNVPKMMALASAALRAGLDPYTLPDNYDLPRIMRENKLTFQWLRSQYVGMGPRFSDERLVLEDMPDRQLLRS